MKCKLCRIFILVSLLLFLSPEISAQEDYNITCINQYYHNWTDGVADVAVQGDYAYLACLEDGLRIVNISNLNSPFDVGHLSSVYGVCVAVSGNYAYIGGTRTNEAAGIKVVDISDPANPVLAATIPASNFTGVLKLIGHRLYSANGGNGMTITDISDPLNPVPLGRLVDFQVFGLDVQGDFVYTAGEWYGMTVWDFSNPANPVELGNFQDQYGYYLNDLEVRDGYAYLAYGGSGLIVVDLATMQQVATIDSLTHAFGVEIEGNTLYMNYGDPECPLAVIDITNPLSPQTLGIYYPPEDIRNFAVDGELVYVADYNHGLRIVDVTDPATPVETAYYNRFGRNLDVRVVGSLAYVRETLDLRILDVSDPQSPLELGHYEPVAGFNDFEIAGSTVFMVESVFQYLVAVDVSDPSNPEVIGTFNSNNDTQYRLVIHDHYAYIVENQGVRIVDIADPSNMTDAGFYSRNIGNAMIETDGQYLYVEDGNEGGIVVLDLANPTALLPVGSLETGGYSTDLTAANGALFASTGNRVLIFDSNNLQATEPLAILNDFDQYNSYVNGVHVTGNRLYLSLPEYGIVVYDIQDLSHPQFVGCFNTPDYAQNSAVSGDILYLADGNNFGIYDCSQAVLDAPQHPVASASEFALLSNYPNPFNSSTQIRFEVGNVTHVIIGVYDVLGRSVVTLADRDFASGTHAIPWNGTDASGRAVASGRYFVMAKAGDAVRSLPIVLLK
jgi:hypothetical protein